MSTSSPSISCSQALAMEVSVEDQESGGHSQLGGGGCGTLSLGVPGGPSVRPITVAAGELVVFVAAFL